MRPSLIPVLMAALAGCGPSQGKASEPTPAQASISPATATLTVTSADVVEGATLALGHAYSGLGCIGSNRSPALSWTPVPGAESYAVSLFDPDAPGGGWWHWTVANIPASVTTLAAGAGGRRGILPPGAIQGRTDFGSAGYGGPCPPVGDRPHRYVFTVYALRTPSVAVDADVDGAAFKAAVEQPAIASGTLGVRYGR